jgi:CDP-glucose 4,6-dehydratase
VGVGTRPVEVLVTSGSTFWKGRSVLITGQTGFKGAWLALWLTALGAEVSGLALDPPTEPNLYGAANVADLIDSTIGDITDSAAVATVIRERQPQAVFHLAAQSLVRESYVRPIETLATNVLGTANVLNAIRDVESVQSVVVVTSDKCYENRNWSWSYRETDALGGHDPYSASKGCAEIVTAAWRRSFLGDLGVASARAGNVLGGGDWAADRLIPDCVRALSADKPVRVRNPTSIRPWQHVLDPLFGYLLLAKRLTEDPTRFSGPWNFGPSEESSRQVSWIVAEVASRWGRPNDWAADPDDGPHEATTLQLDAGRARRELGWRPRLAINETLAWTVDWYRRHQTGTSAQSLIFEQIEGYERLESSS